LRAYSTTAAHGIAGKSLLLVIAVGDPDAAKPLRCCSVELPDVTLRIPLGECRRICIANLLERLAHLLLKVAEALVVLARLVATCRCVPAQGARAVVEQLSVLVGEEVELAGDHVPETAAERTHRSYTSPTVLLIRSWNIFHGRTHPPGGRTFLEEAIRLITGDRPDVLCLQELPVWALGRLGEWSGMQVFADVTVRPALGPVPVPTRLGRRLVEVDPVRFRLAFSGQANAIFLSRELPVLGRDAIALNDRRFVRLEAHRLRLRLRTRLAWTRERRVCQAVRSALPDDRGLVVANLHSTAMGLDPRISDSELMRAASFADALAEPDDVVVLAGDFNAEPERSHVLAELSGPQWGFSKPCPGIDQVLVRGAEVLSLQVWPVEQRAVGGRVLSDHAPVEATVR
jgi:endonuclease/exonuclease/phosphatase family metal-dependent hydrolase